MGSRSVIRTSEQEQLVTSATAFPVARTSTGADGGVSTPSSRGTSNQFAFRPLPQSPQAGALAQPSKKDDADSSFGRAPSLTPRRYGCWQRLFLRHHNEKFADQAETACKSALWLVVLSMPFIMPKGHFEWLDEYVENGYFGRKTVLAYVLIADQSVGQTLANSASAVFGSILAVLNVSMMHSVIPGGVTRDTQWQLLAAVAAHGVLFKWLVLWLNFGMNARIFCLMTFASHWMDFMNPEVDVCSTGPDCGPNTSDIAQVGVAGVLAMAISIFPIPQFALRKAQTNVRDVTAAVNRAWLDVSAHFCGTQTADYKQDRLLADLHRMTSSLEALDAHLVNSWYEFGWFRSVRNMREFIARLKRSLQECSDRLLCTWNTCIQESFSALHDEMMPRLWPHVNKAMVEASGLLAHCTEVACGGRVYDAEEPPLRDAAERTRDAVNVLTVKFREMKSSVGIEGVYEELLDEHNFVIQVCSFGRIVSDLAEDLLAQKGQLRPLPAAEGPPGILDRATLADRNHLSFAVRGFVTILLAFIFGFFGHSKTQVKFDAGAAVFSALLLRKCMGSSRQRNVNRMRAVVISSVFGQVVFATVGWCSDFGYFATGCALFYWVGSSLYQAYEGSHVVGGLSYGYISDAAGAGLLSAYFATNVLVEQCTPVVFTVTDVFGRSYYDIVNSLVAVFIVFSVDSLMTPETSSQLAVRNLNESMRLLTDAVSEVLDPRITKTRPHAVELIQRLLVSESLGRQADMEPRYWRHPWRGLLFGDAVQSAVRLRMSLAGIEFACAEGGRFGAGKAEKVRRFMSLPSFAGVRKVAIEKMEHIEILLDTALTQETGETMYALSNPNLKRNFVGEFVQSMRTFITEVNRLPEMSADKATGSLETDVASQACLMLSCLASIIAEAQACQNSLMMRAY